MMGKRKTFAVLLGFVVLAFCVAIIGLSGILKPTPGLSLVFLRYSDFFDAQIEGVAFLLLTNASDKCYVVMESTNAAVASTFFARPGVLLGILPRQTATALLKPGPVLEVWCDHELTQAKP